MTVNDVEMSQYITDTFPGVDIVVDSSNSFFFYNPDSSVPPDHRFPFITITTNDAYDQYSNLSRESVYRLNIGVSKQTFRSLFGLPERSSENASSDESDESGKSEGEGKYDLTALDTIMPHPEYGMMYWVCILSPSDATFEAKVRPLLAEAYDMAVSKHDKSLNSPQKRTKTDAKRDQASQV